MYRHFRDGLTAVTLAGVLLVLLPLGLGDLQARAPGRDFPRCVQSCNEISKICKSRCDGDCAILFPNDPSLAIDCTQACKAICVTESQDCKSICVSIKNGSAQEP